MAKPPRSLVIGTAGHIDHGKTTLVRALTGEDTDRLPEEKRRGITIELGFAPWKIAADLEASIVDVPGHEGFVRTMVAGAGGIDAVILVVSAEDGVMPQTREHINVCRLLGVERGVVALSKVDRLEDDPEAIELAVEDVREALADTVFEDSAIVPCSAQTGAGIDELRAKVKGLASKIPRRDAKGDAIIPLDRVFTIKGHGTVVTGTLLQGTVDVAGESLRLVRAGERREDRDVRARAAQVRGSERDKVPPGSRIALNLGGIDKGEVARGDVVTRGPTVADGDVFHAWVRHLPGGSPPWKHGTTLQVCIGTAHAVARLDPLYSETDGDVIEPGGEGLVRFRLDSSLPIWRDAHVVIRAFSDPSADHQGLTVGGGVIVDPAPSSGRGQRRRWIAVGRALTSGDASERVLSIVRDAGTAGVGLAEIIRRAGVPDAATRLEQAGGKRSAVEKLGADRYVDAVQVAPLVQAAIANADRFHAQNPMQPGIGRAAIEGMLGSQIAPDVAALAVDRAIARGALTAVDDAGTLGRPGKGVQAGGELPEHMQRVLDCYAERGRMPPTLKEVGANCSLDSRKVLEIVGVLQRTGRLVRVTQDLSFSRDAHDDLLGQVKSWLVEHGTIDVQALKGMTGLSRKFVVPFLEHLDQLQITTRRGDERIPGPRA